MGSSRSPSPVGDASMPTSPQLTPRSKLKAMLAAVDDGSSDDEKTGPIDTKSLFAAIDKNKQRLNPKQPSRKGSINESDESDAEVIRPRGQIAARMHANFTKPDQAPKSPSSVPQRTSPAAEGNNDEDEDEEDVIAPSRRRLLHSRRATTPETTAQANHQSSPGLFVSPSPHKSVTSDTNPAAPDSDDDEDVPTDLSKDARFKALVERKRKERLEKEAEEERQRAERTHPANESRSMDSDDDEDDVSDISDDDGGRKLTQEVSRPTRKASKKALEEMNRETQRLSRSLQLAHEAKTKKKITKASLFKRFNFRTEGDSAETNNKPTDSSRPTTPGSVQQTDPEPEDSGTPPSSPPSAPKTIPGEPTTAACISETKPVVVENDNKDTPTLEDASAQSKTDYKGKGKEKILDSIAPVPKPKQQQARKPVRQVRVRLPPSRVHAVTIDSDDELEITNSGKKDKIDAIFSRIPENKAQESTGMKILRNLAHLSSPPKEPTRGRNAKPAMTFGELHLSLQQRAKAQAKLERERRLEFLRSKGIAVQSTEEREREQEEIEDIVARARQEVEEITAREREEAKKDRKAKQNGAADPLAWDDSDDESFKGSENEEAREVELSGSEDEGQDSDDGEDDEATTESEDEVVEGEGKGSDNQMFVEEAKEAQSEDDDFSDEDIEAMKRPIAFRSRRAKKCAQVVSDDEDNDHIVEATPKPKRTHPKSPSAPGSGSPKPPTSVLRSATKTFIPGLPIAAAAPAGLGLTQIFAGTMDDSQGGPFTGSPQGFMPSIDQFPDSQFSATAGQSQDDDNMVSDSQPKQTATSEAGESQTQGLRLHYSQSQAHGFDSLVQADATQMSDFIEPTQDGGFQGYTPLKQRFVDPPHSTAGTVLLNHTPDDEVIQESPLVRKRGKFLRRGDLDSSNAAQPTEVPRSPEHASAIEAEGLSGGSMSSSDAFRLMEKAARREKRRRKKFDKKKSKATEMVDEQAEESEDEYAGLGGADGEDSSDEDEELIKEMIDDTKGNDGDMAKLAGLFADRERAADAAQVDKLFRDITTGMLRKRRRGGDGHDFDLSDSDDGGEARRRMKRRQFAKMQKALFTDERIGKIAENPRNAAFLKSIEDMHEDEWDFGDNLVDATSTSGDDSQSQNASQTDQAVPDSQPPTTGRKRSRMDEHAPRPGPNERHTRGGVRPASIAEVRRSLSTLLDEPNASSGTVIPATEAGSDSEEEGRPSASRSNKENSGHGSNSKGVVVDRITLKRNSSSLSANGASTKAKLAFTAPSAAGNGFKVPALLRRATTNSSKLVSSSATSTATGSTISQASTSSSSGSLNKAANFGEEGKLKKNAGKRSGINYFAHENERRAKVADAEKRREAKKWKGAEGRSKVVGGLFGSGSFE